MNNELTLKPSAGNYRYLILQTIARICQDSTVHSASLSVGHLYETEDPPSWSVTWHEASTSDPVSCSLEAVTCLLPDL